MLSKQRLFTSILAISLLGPLSAHATLLGPTYPAPGGNSLGSVGTDAGASGGVTYTYSGFNTSQFSSLYWGMDSTALPTAGLDGIAHSLSLVGTSGNVETWGGFTNYTNPTTLTSYTNVPIELQITVTGLGANPWVSFAGVNGGTDPGGVGYVVNNTSGATFSANLAFLANTGSGYVYLDSFQQPASPPNLTNSSVNGAFYYAAPVPLPGAAWLLLSGISGLAVISRKRIGA